MQFFIGIVPPEPYKQRVIEFQQIWKNNWINNVVEPHITLKAQGGLTPDKQWLSKIKEICPTFKAFTISFGKPKFFGEDIVYLSAHSQELYDLHRHLVKSISPSKELIKQYFEMDDFVPHMTLGKVSYGLTKQELKAMAKSAVEKLGPYPTFEVNFIRVYQDDGHNKYIKLTDIPLQTDPD